MPDKKLTEVDESTELLDTDKVIVNASNAVRQITLTNLVNIFKNKIGSLKNPNKLTFTGAVEAEYDGHEPITITIPSGEGGTTDYSGLSNKPQIGGVELNGNKTLEDLGAASSDHNHDDTYAPKDHSHSEYETKEEVGKLKETLEQHINNHPSSGFSSTSINLLIAILRNGVYNTDQSSNITSLENELKNGSTEPTPPSDSILTDDGSGNLTVGTTLTDDGSGNLTFGGTVFIDDGNGNLTIKGGNQ